MNYFFVVCLFLFAYTSSAQENKTYEFYDFVPKENTYNKSFEKKSSENDLNLIFDSLQKVGFYTLQIDSIKNQKIYLNRGKLYQNIWVKNNVLFENKNDYFPTKNLDSIILKFNQEEIANGRPFSSIKIIPNGFHQNELRVELVQNQSKQRLIDGVKLVGYEKLSPSYIKHNLQLKPGKIYNEKKLIEISDKIAQNSFIRETRSPNVLFREDSTYVYLYTEKVRSNAFDGILGFGSDEEGKFRMNGNVTLELNNNFNAMEQIRFNWIGTANKNTTLDIRLRFPYLFKTKIGSETNFKLFKQDSVFVNTNLQERLFYQLTPNSNIGLNLGLQSSNFVLDDYPEIASNYDDYSKTFFGISYDYFLGSDYRILEGKQRLFIQVNSIKKKEKNYSLTESIENKSYNQFEVGIDTYRIFHLGKKHYLKGKLTYYGLFDSSDYFAENELYRIGGFNSIRGFNEESITANQYGILGAEYRFVPNDGFYVALFSDYGMIQNKRMDINTNLLSFGTGISFLTKLGIFNLSYAVGKTENNSFDFKESKIHFGILSQF